MTDSENWWEAAPIVTSDAPLEAAHPVTTTKATDGDRWWEAAPVVGGRPEEGRKPEAESSALSGELDFTSAMRDRAASSPTDVAMSERQRMDRFRNMNAANMLGALAPSTMTAGGPNVLGRLGASATPYAAQGTPMAGTGPTNFLGGLFGR